MLKRAFLVFSLKEGHKYVFKFQVPMMQHAMLYTGMYSLNLLFCTVYFIQCLLNTYLKGCFDFKFSFIKLCGFILKGV